VIDQRRFATRLSMALAVHAYTLRGLLRDGEALAAAQEAVDMAQRAGDEMQLADAMTAKALALHSLNRAADAKATGAQAMTIFQRAPHLARHERDDVSALQGMFDRLDD
jgi:hypothetical protein